MKSPVDITNLKKREVSYAQELQFEIFRGSNNYACWETHLLTIFLSRYSTSKVSNADEFWAFFKRHPKRQ